MTAGDGFIPLYYSVFSKYLNSKVTARLSKSSCLYLGKLETFSSARRRTRNLSQCNALWQQSYVTSSYDFADFPQDSEEKKKKPKIICHWPPSGICWEIWNLKLSFERTVREVYIASSKQFSLCLAEASEQAKTSWLEFPVINLKFLNFLSLFNPNNYYQSFSFISVCTILLFLICISPTQSCQFAHTALVSFS